MSDRPEPASPLPWKEWNASIMDGIEDADGQSLYWCGVDGNGFATTRFHNAPDRAYLVWACNNAPKLEARIEQLEAALRRVDCAMQDVLGRGYYSDGEGLELHKRWLEIRKALE